MNLSTVFYNLTFNRNKNFLVYSVSECRIAGKMEEATRWGLEAGRRSSGAEMARCGDAETARDDETEELKDNAR